MFIGFMSLRRRFIGNIARQEAQDLSRRREEMRLLVLGAGRRVDPLAPCAPFSYALAIAIASL
jgi:hypothetical protein